MRIKQDFVTNSSSACFLVAIHKTEQEKFEKFLVKLNSDPMSSNEGVGYTEKWKNLKELQDFVNGHPYDWASYPRGLDFKNMEEEHYNTCKECFEAIPEDVIYEVRVDYNACDSFLSKYDKCIIEEVC